MENNTITIHFDNENEVVLNTSNPDINSLVKAIVRARDTIDANSIKVTSEIDNFDADGFTTLMQKLVTKYIEALRLENEQFENAILQVNKNVTL